MIEEFSTVTVCEGSIYAACSINKVKSLALIDTGSAVNLISENKLERLHLGKVKLYPNTKRLFGVTGNTLDVKGRIENIPVCIDPSREIISSTDLFVVADLLEDLILGQKFLAQHKFEIDFNSNRLRNNYFSTKLLFGKSCTYRVIVEQGIEVKEMALVACKVVNEKGESPWSNFTGQYWGEEFLGYASKKDTVLCVVENGSMDVCFANLCNPAIVKIQAGSVIGWISGRISYRMDKP